MYSNDPLKPSPVSVRASVRSNLDALTYGRAKTGMVMHARGIEHHTNGVNNVLSYINLVLATGKIGAPGRGYGAITGQGNGQGGREHGQKADQLPGQRSVLNPEHRRYVCGVWGLPEEELPQAGVSVVEMFGKMREGEIRGLLSVCNNVMVSLPDINEVRRSLEGLDFYVCIDFFMSESARYADVVLPGSAWSEDEGVTWNSEGRVVYQYLSGNQTRRIGFLVQQCPEPYVEIHPETAAALKVSDGERVKVVSRRGEGVFPVLVVRTIRPDTIFIPYHWGEQLAANQLTNPALDPTSKIPEYKACAARVEKSGERRARMNVPSNAREDAQAGARARETQTRYPVGDAPAGRRRSGRGRTAVEQARLVMLVMINVAQLWILAATVEAALAKQYGELPPLVIASGVCWLVSLSIILWWRPASRRHTSTGYIREGK